MGLRPGLRDVRVRDLKPGDVLFPTDRTVVMVAPPASGKCRVSVFDSKRGHQTVTWGASTIITIYATTKADFEQGQRELAAAQHLGAALRRMAPIDPELTRKRWANAPARCQHCDNGNVWDPRVDGNVVACEHCGGTGQAIEQSGR